MSYIKTNLNTGEKLKYYSRISSKALIVNYSFFILIAFVAGYLITDWFLGLFISLIVLVIVLPFAIIDYFGSEFGVTGKRVVSKKGIISRNASEMNLSSIESVNIDQGIVGRILNFGTLKISGRGTTTVNFANIDEPVKVRKLIQNKS